MQEAQTFSEKRISELHSGKLHINLALVVCAKEWVMVGGGMLKVTGGCSFTHQAIAVAYGHSSALCANDVSHVQTADVQGLCAGALALPLPLHLVALPLHLGSGSHQSRVKSQTQVQLPAEDGDIVVEMLLDAAVAVAVTARLLPIQVLGVTGRTRLSAPAPTELPSAHLAR